MTDFIGMKRIEKRPKEHPKKIFFLQGDKRGIFVSFLCLLFCLTNSVEKLKKEGHIWLSLRCIIATEKLINAYFFRIVFLCGFYAEHHQTLNKICVHQALFSRICISSTLVKCPSLHPLNNCWKSSTGRATPLFYVLTVPYVICLHMMYKTTDTFSIFVSLSTKHTYSVPMIEPLTIWPCQIASYC